MPGEKCREIGLSRSRQLEEALSKLGGEPLGGSGFEDEAPDAGFSGAVRLDSTFVTLID